MPKYKNVSKSCSKNEKLCIVCKFFDYKKDRKFQIIKV